MNDLDTIEDYFAGQLSEGEKARFEQQIVADPELAEAVAFYIQAKQIAHTEAIAKRKETWETIRKQESQISRPIWMPISYAAAACIVLLLGFFLFWPNQQSAEQLADQYIQTNLTTLSVTLSSQSDSLQLARQAYNAGRFAEAEDIIQTQQQRDSSNAELLKLAGLVSLRRGNYDQAINQFHRLSQRTNLRANPGLFYEALTHLKRAQPNDKTTAQQLLQTVIDQNLDGKKAAEALSKDLK